MATTTIIHGSLLEIRSHWMYWLSMGGVLMALGVLCLVIPVAATLATMVVLGASLEVAGISQAVIAIRDEWAGSLLYVPVGLIEFGVGVYLLFQPAEGALALTLLISFYLVITGIVRSALAFTGRFDGWGWLFAAGLVTIVLGVIVYGAWPASGLWFAGLCVGVSLLSQGMATVAVAIEAHRGTGTTARPA